MDRVIRIVGAVLGLHLVAGLLHGVPHFEVPVELGIWKWVFVILVINLAPIVGFVLIWRGDLRLGSAVFAVSMAGALMFGIYLHFIASNPDNVTHVEGVWHLPFLSTAVLVALTDFAGIVTGVWIWIWETSPTSEPRL